jgi:hypothetical protein
VQSAFEPTVRGWDGSYYVPAFNSDQAGRVGRVVMLSLLSIAFLYCGSIAWDVLQGLREVKLVELRSVVEKVSVGDAILTWLAYVIGRDLLRSALQ